MNIKWTVNELQKISNINNKIKSLKKFFIQNDLNSTSTIPQEWYDYLKKFKTILGNINNDISLISCLMVKEYLLNNHLFCDEIDVAKKPQGAPGLDIDEETKEGKRLIAEIKTTYPYGENDLGANQKKSIKNDFKKLKENEAEFKYFFVTEKKTYIILKKKYKKELEGIILVLLKKELEKN